MIMLSGKKKVDVNLYDYVFFATTTCPGMPVGCIHRPDLAAPKSWERLCYNGETERFLEMYESMWHTDLDKINALRDLVELSESGKWIQLVFYEDDCNDGERPILYKILKEWTSNVKIE